MRNLLLFLIFIFVGCATTDHVFQDPKPNVNNAVTVFKIETDKKFLYDNDSGTFVNYTGHIYYANTSKRPVYGVRGQATLYADGYKEPKVFAIIDHDGPITLQPEEAHDWEIDSTFLIPNDFDGDLRIHYNFWYNVYD